MNIRKQIKGLAVELAVLGFAVYSAKCQDTINQTGAKWLYIYRQ